MIAAGVAGGTKVDTIDPAALSAVDPGALRAYLDARGWCHLEPYGQHGDVYARDEAPEIVAPTTSALHDYPRRIAEIVDILATVEDRDALRVYRDLTTAAFDLIRVRAPGAEGDGSIPLDRGVVLMHESRELLLAAACASVRSAATFRTGAIREATDYLRDVRMGQTERDGFVVTMLSPVPRDLAPRTRDLLGDPMPSTTETPFPRRVTCRLVESLQGLKEALVAVERGADVEAFRERVPLGVSANLCEAASRLAAAGDGIGVSLSWALTRSVHPRYAARPDVELTKAEAATLGEAARVLRDREARSGERLQGMIVRLSRGAGAVGGRVALKALVDGAMVSVSVVPRPSDDDAFVEAYRQRREVIVEGELRRVGQRWRLKDPRHVVVLPAESDDPSEEDLLGEVD